MSNKIALTIFSLILSLQQNILQPAVNEQSVVVQTINLSHPQSGTGVNYDEVNDVIEIMANGSYVIYGGVDFYETTIRVERSVVANIKIVDVKIDARNEENRKAFDIDHATVVLELSGSNIFYSGLNAAGISVPNESSLTIWAENNSHSLRSIGNGNGAGIGGNIDQNSGTIIINSGNIYAESNDDTSPYVNTGGAGIGGGGTNNFVEIGNSARGDNGYVKITGGIVNALSDTSGAGIGGGGSDYGSNGGTIIIEGGKISATSMAGGAGIGGGGYGRSSYQGNTLGGSSGSILIAGGDIEAYSLMDWHAFRGEQSGAGIGSASYGKIDSITILGGNITASATNGAAIGSGGHSNNDESDIVIENATIKVSSGLGAGIGTGYLSFVRDIYIRNSQVNATSMGGSSIGSGLSGGVNDIYIEASNIVTNNDFSWHPTRGEISGAGIGSGSHAKVNDIYIMNSIVELNSGLDSAAIGSGIYGDSNDIMISGSSTMVSITVVKEIGYGATSIGSADSPKGVLTLSEGATIILNNSGINVETKNFIKGTIGGKGADDNNLSGAYLENDKYLPLSLDILSSKNKGRLNLPLDLSVTVNGIQENTPFTGTITLMYGDEVIAEGISIIEGTANYTWIPDSVHSATSLKAYYVMGSDDNYASFVPALIEDFEITDSRISVEDISDYIYTGYPITPAVNVTHDGKMLTESLDYTVQYENNVEIGQARVIIKGINDYTGEIVKTYNIIEVPKIYLVNAVISNIEDQNYTGQAITPVISVVYGDRTLVKNTDYTLVYENNVEVGQARVIIKGINDYTGEVVKTYNILATPAPKISLTNAVIGDIEDQKYTGQAITPVISVVYGDRTLVKNTDYTLVYENNVEVGQARVIIKGINDYSEEVERTFNIVAASKNTNPVFSDNPSSDYQELPKEELVREIEIVNTMISDITNQGYTGKPITPAISVIYEEKVLIENTDYTVEFRNNIEIGQAEVIVSGINEYTGEVIKTFNIVEVTSTDDTPHADEKSIASIFVAALSIGTLSLAAAVYFIRKKYVRK